MENCPRKNEFFNAGISPFDLFYAYENRIEFIAVAGQGDCSKYSGSFKKFLVKLGLPEYVLKMKPVEEDIIQNANYLAANSQSYPAMKDMDNFYWLYRFKTIDEETLKTKPEDFRLYFSSTWNQRRFQQSIFML